MALKLIANYSKKVGLPAYSSHQFSICVETEITSLDDVAGESSRLYETLQRSVDEEIQKVGFTNAHGPANGNGTTNSRNVESDSWACSEKQREFILKLVSEHDLEKGEVERVAKEMFGVGVRELNKLQASGLIDRILADHGGEGRNGSPRGSSEPPPRESRRRPYQREGAR